jgi:hypothetical protein
MSAFFIVLLGSSGRTSPIVFVEGVAASGGIGSVFADNIQTVDVSGVLADGLVGSVTSTISVEQDVLGVGAIGQVGIPFAFDENDVLTTGVVGTALVSSPTISGDSSVVLSGVSGQAQLGNESIQIGGNITTPVSGVSATASVRPVTVALLNNISVLLTGVSSTASSGLVTVSSTSVNSVVGVSATANVRPVSVNASASVSVTGVSASGAVSSVSAVTQQLVNVTGVSSSGQVSAVTTSVTAFVSVNVTGVSGTANVGAVAARTSDDFIVVANNTSPFLHAYEWDNSTGFGAKFADPASAPAAVSGMSLLNDGGTRYLAVADSNSTTTPPFFIYTISGTTGWGSRSTYNPTDSSPRSGLKVLWINNSSGNFLVSAAAVKAAENTVYVEKFSSGSFTGTTAKARPVDSAGNDISPRSLGYVRITSSASGVFYGMNTTPFIKGRVLTDATPALAASDSQPSTLPPSAVVSMASYTESVSSNPRGVLFAAHSSSPYVTAYQITDSVFGTKYSNPSPAFAGNATGVSYRPTSTVGIGEIAASMTASPYVNAYQWTTGSGFGIKYSNPSTLPPGSGQTVAFNPSGNCVAVGHSTSPFISAYPWTRGDGFGTRFSNPVTTLSSAVTQVAFSN